MNINIRVRLQVEGIHQREGCPLKEVEFLKDKHRHIFHIEATKEVSHGDRDIEIIMFKRNIEDYLYDKYYEDDSRVCFFRNMSCEMIATELINQFDLKSCEVMEDGEVGSLVTKQLKCQ